MYDALGFHADVRDLLVAQVGLDSATALSQFTGDDIKELLKQVRKDEAARIATTNASATAAATGGVAPTIISATPIPYIVEKRLVIVVREIRIRKEINRAIDSIYETTLDDLEQYEENWSQKESWEDPTTGAPDANTISKNWVNGFEILDEWISAHVETSNMMPLGFVIRREDPDDSAWDPDNYLSIRDAYNKRTEITDSVNAYAPRPWAGRCIQKLWDILYAIFKDHAAYQHMKSHKKSRNGRLAYFALRDHYLGPNNVNNMAAALEAEYNSLHYNGETRRWTFEKYVNKMVELHNVSEDLKEHGYAGIDETSRVRKLLAGIKTDKLNVIKGQVLASPILSKDFSSTVNLFKDYIAQTNSLQSSSGPNAMIASVSTDKKKGKKGKNKKRDNAQVSQVKIQDRFYTQEEYAKFTKEERKQLHDLRKKRKTSGDSKDTVEARIAALEAHMSTEVNNSNGSPAPAQTSSTSNRSNPALERNAPRRE